MLTVAIIGKPNVGKSTLFNRIIGKQKSIVDDIPGVTRDRIYDQAEWLTKQFELIDTGGLENKNDNFQVNINEQVEFAIQEASVIIFVTSFVDGINEDDFYVAKLLKKKCKNKKIILCANKSEKQLLDDQKQQFYNLGYGKPFFVSSAHGIGIGDLLDEIIKFNNISNINDVNDQFFYSFCVIGRPNVGKSTLFNTLVNENRVIVSEIPGSTRDSIDTIFTYRDKKYKIIDTAGIRRKGKIKTNVEKYSIIRAERAIKNAQIILLMIDIDQGFSEQDEVIGGLAHNANIPTIIVVNKWDLVEKDTYTMSKIKGEIKNRFKYLSWAPIIFISAKNKSKIDSIFISFEKIHNQINKHISTSLLNNVVLKAQMIQEAPIFKGGRIKIKYITQVKSQIPTFTIFCNNSKYLHFSYARYIENKIRDAFGLDMIPITLYWKTSEENNYGK